MTLYDLSRAEFSNKAHASAQRIIYPVLFQTSPSNLSYHSTLVQNGGKDKILDGELGVDLIVEVMVKKLRNPLKFVFQERWRKPEYQHFQDMTITEWNHKTNLPSELYKITAGMFLYGYYDAAADDILEAVTIDVTALLYAIATDKLRWELQPVARKQQTFVYIDFKALQDASLIVFHHK